MHPGNTEIRLFDLFRLTQMIGTHSSATAAVTNVSEILDLFAAQVPRIRDEGTTPVTFRIRLFYGHTHVTQFADFFSACGTYISSHMDPPYEI